MNKEQGGFSWIAFSQILVFSLLLIAVFKSCDEKQPTKIIVKQDKSTDKDCNLNKPVIVDYGDITVEYTKREDGNILVQRFEGKELIEEEVLN